MIQETEKNVEFVPTWRDLKRNADDLGKTIEAKLEVKKIINNINDDKNARMNCLVSRMLRSKKHRTNEWKFMSRYLVKQPTNVIVSSVLKRDIIDHLSKTQYKLQLKEQKHDLEYEDIVIEIGKTI
jgi:hypothetical protein